MKLYHYTTWLGVRIKREGIIKPSRRYGFGEVTVLTPWPELIFLTTNSVWEPSVQAKTQDGLYEKCGSCVDVYNQLGIPCHKFEVDVAGTLTIGDFMHLPGWCSMLLDACILGSDVTQWRIYDKEIIL